MDIYGYLNGANSQMFVCRSASWNSVGILYKRMQLFWTALWAKCLRMSKCLARSRPPSHDLPTPIMFFFMSPSQSLSLSHSLSHSLSLRPTLRARGALARVRGARTRMQCSALRSSARALAALPLPFSLRTGQWRGCPLLDILARRCRASQARCAAARDRRESLSS
jgi:hypothetical protein